MKDIRSERNGANAAEDLHGRHEKRAAVVQVPVEACRAVGGGDGIAIALSGQVTDGDIEASLLLALLLGLMDFSSNVIRTQI